MHISVGIICYNEAQNIERCLESVSWADEIIVVDSGSQDNTVSIAKKYTDHIFQRSWTGYADQKNFALSRTSCPWVLSVDADEVVSPVLQAEIRAHLAMDEAKDGYRIPRLSYYQGKWIRHSGFYPDRQLRLFKRGRGRWIGGRVHERVEIEGDVGCLKNDLLHYPYKGGITGQLQTVNNFSTLLAEDLFHEGKGYHFHLLLMRPLFKFLEVYLLRLGFLDGLPGFVIAVTSSYAMFVRYVKLREMEKGLGHERSG